MRKTTYANNVFQDVRNYVNGVEYTNNTLERLPHTEGEIIKDGSGNYVYEYTLKDHLGNTRVTFGDADNNGVVENSDIKQINHYFPFGLNMAGPGFGVAGANKYQFNGKEWNDDFGLGWNHHDWRFYDVAIDRFVTVDPEGESGDQESWTPYHFGFNNPIRFDDPDGQCPNCATAAAGAVIGGAIGGLWEAGAQLYNDGKISNWGAVGGAAVQGAITGGAAGFTGGASLLTTVAVGGVANGVGGAANNAIQGKSITAGSVAKDVATGAALGAAGHLAGKAVTAGLNKLSNAAKGKLGETVTQVKYAVKGYKSDGIAKVRTGGITSTGRVQAAHYDHSMRNVVTGKRLTVESKFNTARLTGNQVAARPNVVTPGGLIIDRTTSQQLGNTVKGVITGSSGQIKHN